MHGRVVALIIALALSLSAAGMLTGQAVAGGVHVLSDGADHAAISDAAAVDDAGATGGVIEQPGFGCKSLAHGGGGCVLYALSATRPPLGAPRRTGLASRHFANRRLHATVPEPLLRPPIPA
ncbi:MAG: hypothetical protein ACTSP2_00700 [Alphaproteobacteria bacterium]